MIVQSDIRNVHHFAVINIGHEPKDRGTKNKLIRVGHMLKFINRVLEFAYLST